MITKTILSKTDYYIQFSEEELQELHIKPGDKFTWEIKDGGVLLTKHIPLELDLEDFHKETLIFLIQESCRKDSSVNDVIAEILEEVLIKNDK